MTEKPRSPFHGLLQNVKLLRPVQGRTETNFKNRSLSRHQVVFLSYHHNFYWILNIFFCWIFNLHVSLCDDAGSHLYCRFVVEVYISVLLPQDFGSNSFDIERGDPYWVFNHHEKNNIFDKNQIFWTKTSFRFRYTVLPYISFHCKLSRPHFLSLVFYVSSLSQMKRRQR